MPKISSGLYPVIDVNEGLTKTISNLSEMSVMKIPFGLASTPRFNKRRLSSFFYRVEISRAMANTPVTF